MGGLKILLPYNFTVNDRKALEFVVRTFSNLDEVECTLFYACTPIPEITAGSDSVMGKLRENLAYLNQKISEQEAELLSVKTELTQKGFAQERVKHLFKPRKKDISAEIIGLVGKEKYDIIVLNRKPGKVTRFFTGSVYMKVVAALRDVTVCIVS